MKNRISVVTVGLVSTLLMCACSSNQPETSVATQTQTRTAAPQAPVAEEVTELEGYRFKLTPDVQPDGVAHLDFYVRDLADKHVKGVKGTFRITKPDGSKAEIPIEEESPHDHYHGMLKLDQPGEYLIVTQVSVGDKKLNPRFSFTKKQ
jgi:hypothetical protein